MLSLSNKDEKISRRSLRIISQIDRLAHVFSGRIIGDNAPSLKPWGRYEFAVNGPDNVLIWIDQNGGIRIYRDDIRIYNYGEPGDDWLGLDRSDGFYPTINTL